MADEVHVRPLADIADEHKVAWVAGDFQLAARLCAEARGNAEYADPHSTVEQVDGGLLYLKTLLPDGKEVSTKLNRDAS